VQKAGYSVVAVAAALRVHAYVALIESSVQMTSVKVIMERLGAVARGSAIVNIGHIRPEHQKKVDVGSIG
jgi:hypothetical protein